MPKEVVGWAGFIIFVLVMLAVDLGLFQRKAHEIRVRESLLLTAFWVSLALIFGLGIYWFRGPGSALEFLTGYLIEESLSMDNIFVFFLIFTYFNVPPSLQRTALFWGILGAIVFRAVFIICGLTLIHKFHWLIYAFGVILLWTGVKLALEKDRKFEPERNPVLRVFRKFVPTTTNYEGNQFFIKKEARWFATPLFVVLLVVETTDIIFAVDSIPAIFAVTLDPFIVYTSNIFAILGLRALYFTLAGMVRQFHFLHYGLALILVFVGVKMLLSDFYHMPIALALGVVVGILTLSIVASLVWPQKKG